MSNSAQTFNSNMVFGSRLYNEDLKVLDALYGPWESLDEFIQTVVGDDTLSINDVLSEIPQGITVGIFNKTGEVVEWWNPIAGLKFVLKFTSFEIPDDIQKTLEAIGNPASDDYLPETYYQEGDDIPDGKEIGDVKTELIGTAPTGLFDDVLNAKVEEVSKEKIDSLFIK